MNEEKNREFDCVFEDNTAGIRRMCGSALSADIARKMSECSVSEIRDVLTRINPHKAARIYNYFSDSLQRKIAGICTDDEIAGIIDFLEPDEQADAIKMLKGARRKRVLQLLPDEDSRQASNLAAYAEGTAGAVMTKSFMELSLNDTVRRAKAEIAEFDDIKNLHYVFLTDSQGRVSGYFRMVQLLNISDDTVLEDICESEVISVGVYDDQERAARKLQYYDLLAIAVVDEAGCVLGVITYDDAFDVIVKEQTEDMRKIMAMTSSDDDNGDSYFQLSVWRHFKNRITWIVALAVLGLVSGYVLHKFEDVLSGLVILALYMPMLADTGGNTGSQSSTLIIRAIALGELKSGDVLRVISKEFRVSIMVSVILMGLTFVKIVILSGGAEMPSGYTLGQIGLAISVALGIQVVSATLIGAVLPVLVNSFKLDPAVIAAPAITSIVDITGLLIYFYTVGAMLGI